MHFIHEIVQQISYSNELLIRPLDFVQVFALENPDVNVLSYSPGPVETDMFHTVYETIANPDTKKKLKRLHETNTVLTTEQTVNRLVKILKEHKYNAGDRVDYFDDI